MKQNKKIILAMIISVLVYRAFILLANRNTMLQGKVVLFIEIGSRVECQEIMLEDCRDECIDYCRDKGSLLFVNSKNQIVERNIAGEEQIINIETVDFKETVSNVQYAPLSESIYYIYEDDIYQYSLDDNVVTKKTDGIGSDWRRTYIWKNDEYGYKLVDNGKFSELYSMDMYEKLEQKVCEIWIQSIGQVQENKIYALEVYSNATQNASATDLRNRIIAIDVFDGNVEIIQEIGNWTEGNYLFACNEDDIFYIRKKGKKEHLYRMNLDTGLEEKVYSTRNKVIGLAMN